MKQVFTIGELEDNRYYIQYDPEPSKRLILTFVDVIALPTTRPSNAYLHIASMIESITSANIRGIEGPKIYTGSGGLAHLNLPDGDEAMTYVSHVFELDYNEIERHIILETL